MRTQTGELAVLAEEPLGVDGVDPLATLFVCGGHPEQCRVGGPRVALGTALRRLGHDLELLNTRRTLPVGGAQAVGAGVATTDDDDALALRRDRRLTICVHNIIAELHLIGPGQVLHGLVDALELAAGNRQVTPGGRSAREDHRVEV
ncbi:Uncharacterised protein [Mycobacteroides abscessus subsp. abscessus]|nr:Uncharacterised protein [Mycobacteroides abscessus subsp. abscessus]